MVGIVAVVEVSKLYFKARKTLTVAVSFPFLAFLFPFPFFAVAADDDEKKLRKINLRIDRNNIKCMLKALPHITDESKPLLKDNICSPLINILLKIPFAICREPSFFVTFFIHVRCTYVCTTSV